MSACHIHPAKAALGGCTSCGRFVCEVCMNKVQGKIICDMCTRLSVQQRTSGPLLPTPSNHLPSRQHSSQNNTPQIMITPHTAVNQVRSVTNSLSQKHFTVLNVMVTLVTIGMLESLSIIFWMPATVILWYLWFQRRRKGNAQSKETLISQEICQLAMLNKGEVSLGQLAAQGRYTMDDYEEEVHKLTARGVIQQVLDEEQGTIKYYMN